MALLFDIIPEMSEAGEEQFITPESLQLYTTYEDDLDKSVLKVSQALEAVLKEIGIPAGISKIVNIRRTLVIQEEVLNCLLETYTEVHGLFKRMEQLLSSGMFDEVNQEIIRSRVESTIDEQLFQTQQEVFFKIVNAKEVAEGEKNIDGPALLFPGIEKVKNQIIHWIERQIRELGPVAINLCKSFQGIADVYIEAEELVNERERYDSIYQTFGQERDLRRKYIRDITPARMAEASYIESLVGAFEELKTVYRDKADSLKHVADSQSIAKYRNKLKVLNRGQDAVDERLKPLQVLKRMSGDFPRLVKQLDFFADSHYQARAVFRVLEEIREEMKHVFKRYDLDSFTVVSYLKYKLNGVSHMYESIHYYYAATQIEKDMRQALQKRYQQVGDETSEVATYLMETSDIPGMLKDMHQFVALMNQENYKVHQIFLEYKEKQDLALFKSGLKEKTQKINALYSRMKGIYKEAQQVFADFLVDDLGATDLESQINTYLKTDSDLPELKAIYKGYKTLFSTRRKALAAMEKQVAKQFNDDLNTDQISAIALLKVKKDFLQELLGEIQHYPQAQGVFLELLKEFIKLRDDAENQKINDPSILWMVENMAAGALETFRDDWDIQDEQSAMDADLSRRKLVVAFLSQNITPHEIESFSRLLPVLPRNELHLDTSFGRLLLDIIKQYSKFIQTRAGSGTHLIEKIYEKRERIRLVANIHAMFQVSADPFNTKIEKEENKSNHLIKLQRMKYRKELGEVVKYWQYLIQEQIEPGQGQRGRFRRYSEAEKKLMMKYISPEQLELIDRQLASGFDLEAEGELPEVEGFLMEVADGLFKLLREDDRTRSEFEAFVLSKRFLSRNIKDEEKEDPLSSRNFMPNIRAHLRGETLQPSDNRRAV